MKIAILENIRSAHNVGSIFRTADGAGVDKIYLLGYTSTPIDRFGRVQQEIQKTSLGASESITWEHYKEHTNEVVKKLRADGVSVVAVEQGKSAVPIKEFNEPAKVAYIFGNEVDGVSTQLQELADTIVELPMLGQKESLNVSVAAGIVLYHGIT